MAQVNGEGREARDLASSVPDDTENINSAFLVTDKHATRNNGDVVLKR